MVSYHTTSMRHPIQDHTTKIGHPTLEHNKCEESHRIGYQRSFHHTFLVHFQIQIICKPNPFYEFEHKRNHEIE